MKRKALIIGSPLSTRHAHHLQGVSQDIDSYVNFLCSSVGGGWHRAEIVTLVNPSSTTVNNEISKLRGADFAFVVFSGHGARKEVDYIQINDQQIIPLHTLNSAAKKQILISDACRTEHRMSYFEGLGGLDFEFDQRSKHVSRSLYDYFIANIGNGAMTLSSCSPGETSEDGKNGGYFTTGMLELLHHWSVSRNEVRLTVENAFKATYQKLASKQRPTATTTEDSMKNFPLALNPTAYLQATQVANHRKAVPAGAHAEEDNFSGVVGVLAVGLLAGCLIAAIVD